MINWRAVGSPLRGEEEWHWELPFLLGHPAAKFSGWSQRCRRSGIRGVYHRALFLRCRYLCRAGGSYSWQLLPSGWHCRA